MKETMRSKDMGNHRTLFLLLQRLAGVTTLQVTLIVLLLVLHNKNVADGYNVPIANTKQRQQQHHSRSNRNSGFILMAQKEKQSRGTSTSTITKKNNVDDTDDDEKPAGIVGAQFFGGDKQKEEFYDPIAELEAGLELQLSLSSSAIDDLQYNRFNDRSAFPNSFVANVAESLQDQINHVLFDDEDSSPSSIIPTTYTYASKNMKWETVFPKTGSSMYTTPIQELENALNFYRRLNVAIICGTTIETTTTTTSSSIKDVQLRWEISVLWPTIWEPRILLTGSSILSIDTNTNQIIQQKDVLDGELFSTILKQFLPRFWDIYHIGMTPAAEVSPLLVPAIGSKRNIFSSYTVQDIPSRIVVQPTIYDTDRDDANASVLPNHAFTCVIKTMGPEKQFYTPVTGVQVRLIPIKKQQDEDSNRLQIQWYIPIATEYMSNRILQLPGPDSEIIDIDQRRPTCNYTFVPQRMVATVPYGGSAQDSEITKMRKQLYDQVIKDGYTPKIDSGNGRPIFFFTMNSIKACYTNEGLGMAVYEWRPQFTKPNEIGIELEI